MVFLHFCLTITLRDPRMAIIQVDYCHGSQRPSKVCQILSNAGKVLKNRK